MWIPCYALPVNGQLHVFESRWTITCIPVPMYNYMYSSPDGQLHVFQSCCTITCIRIPMYNYMYLSPNGQLHYQICFHIYIVPYLLGGATKCVFFSVCAFVHFSPHRCKCRPSFPHIICYYATVHTKFCLIWFSIYSKMVVCSIHLISKSNKPFSSQR